MTTYQPPTERLRRIHWDVHILLEQRLPKTLSYHNAAHTLDPRHGVVAVADALATQEGLALEERELLLTAAYYHDTGFIERYKDNEGLGAEFASKVLPAYGYSPEQIKKVQEMILGTHVPTNPKNRLEEILCDADVDNLGREDFMEKNEAVRRELGINDLKQWYEGSIRFLESHRFYTAPAKKLRDAGKQKNLEALRQRLKAVENIPPESWSGEFGGLFACTQFTEAEKTKYQIFKGP